MFNKLAIYETVQGDTKEVYSEYSDVLQFMHDL
jgi:hypothetical protein